MSRTWTATGALLLAAGVIIGAFGAHGLKDTLSPYGLAIYEKAVFYHMVHAVGVLALGLSSLGLLSERLRSWVCSLLGLGILIFSGSLYLLAITELKILGAITPIGGTAFIVAWTLLAVGVLRSKRR